MEAKVAYVRQELKPERLQPKVDHLQEGLGGTTEETKIQGKVGDLRLGMEETMRLPHLAATSGALAKQLEAKVSRVETHTERHRERYERRQESSEQDVPRQEQTERRRERRERRLERQESSEQEAARHDPKGGG